MNFRRIMEKGLDYLESGRRANHDFVVKTNMRTLRSGPNRGKVRVDGAVLIMFGNRNRSFVQTAIVRNGESLLSTLDEMAQALQYWSE
jgi:hypothetical protein